MAVSEHSVVINVPIDVVFRNTTCLRGCVNWISSSTKAEKLTDGPVGVGSQYRESYKFMGRFDETVVTITRYDPPHEFSYEDPKVPMEWHYTFDEVPGGTRIHMKLTLSPAEYGTLDPEMVVAAAQKQYQIDLNNLKTLLESGVKVNVD